MSLENKSINVEVELPLDVLAEQLARLLGHDDAIKFVKELDRAVADYDVTKELRDYFTEEVAKEDAGEEADAGGDR